MNNSGFSETLEMSRQLTQHIIKLEAKNRKLTLAIEWALGEDGSFPSAPVPRKNPIHDYWRSELRDRAGFK